MHSDCCLCGYCGEKDKSYNRLDVQDEQWLDEMGDMIAATVEAMRKVPSTSAGCYGRLATA